MVDEQELLARIAVDPEIVAFVLELLSVTIPRNCDSQEIRTFSETLR